MSTYSIFKFSISHFLAIGISNIGATLVSCKQFSVTAVPFRLRGSKRNMKYDKGMWAWPVPVINSLPAQKSYQNQALESKPVIFLKYQTIL